MASRYERNILLQPGLIREVMRAPRPPWMDGLKGRRTFFVGIGSSYHAAQIAQRLWRSYVSPRAWAVNSFDFARAEQPVGRGDLAVLISHRGTKSFTVACAGAARRAGAVTVALTGRESPWRLDLAHRLETCEMEDTGVFTKSLTCTLAWIARWIASPALSRGLGRACSRLGRGPGFPRVGADADLVLLGDLEREWVARETALKVQESSYVPARAFGLEEFLHGPRISVGRRSRVVGFSDRREPRWEAARDYLKKVGVPFTEVDQGGLIPEAAWLFQLFWGQSLALSVCRGLGIDPDAMRRQDPRYRRARESLSL